MRKKLHFMATLSIDVDATTGAINPTKEIEDWLDEMAETLCCVSRDNDPVKFDDINVEGIVPV